MYAKEIQVPAKGMLFGEYGVLQNFPAVVVTFYEPHFLIRVEINKSDSIKHSHVYVKSSFFREGFISFYLGSTSSNETFAKLPKEADFFYKLLHPWQQQLLGFDISLEILKSFTPSLGFGSSSAIIAGISFALYEYFMERKVALEDKQLWRFVQNSILNIQGSGSGYDVGAQLASILSSTKATNCWSFQRQILSDVPLVKKLNIPLNLIKQYGCFLKTQVYSDTKKALSIHSNSEQKNEYRKMHGKLALKFLQDSSLESIKKLMKKSKEIAKRQGLFPESQEFENLILTLKDVSFKSMGAGFGDCLWVLCSRRQLVEECAFVEEDIAFAFED